MFETLFIKPILNLLVAIYQLVMSVGLPGALGFSIIILTAVIRIFLYPLTRAQIQTQKKMQAVAPYLAKIKDKHKGDMRAQQEATMALYREHNLNPAAGCLPIIIQLPLFIGLYNVLVKVTQFNTVSDLNALIYFDSIKLDRLWNLDFFGLPLARTPAELFPQIGIPILLVVIITGGLQFIQSKMMTPAVDKLAASAKDKKPDDFAATFQKQTTYILPIMIGIFSYTFSIGLSLYWNTFTLFGIIQQYTEAGLGGLEPWFKKK